MILYVVELEMDAALREDYMAWLVSHVHEMLTLPGFIDAELMVRLEPPPPDGRWVVCAHYRLRDRRAWQTYLSE